MEAKDFRKGNYVQDVVSGEWMIIDEIGENIGAVIINRDKYPLPDGWQMGPIPLTPEILEKAGFATLTPVHLWKKESFGTLTFKLKNFGSFHFFDSGATSFRPAGNPSMILRYEPKHLHQLQNLYFALTGEELKIEL